jgi:hypothetical protein
VLVVREPRMSETGSGDVRPGTGVRCGVRHQGAAARQRRRRLLGWMLVPTAVAAAGVTAVLLAACGSQPPAAPAAPAALAVVTGALARTSAQSYSFSLDSAVHLRGRQLHSDLVSGAFDPRRGLGTELLATRTQQRPVTAEIRFIARYVYTRVSPGSGSLGRPWNKSPLPPATADGIPPGYEVYGFVTDLPVSPAELSGVLRSAGTVRKAGSASGPGWTGTRYAFIARFPRTAESLSATVYVDQQGRVRRLVTISTQGRLTTDRDLEFGDFGAPVPVTPPPATQVKYTSYPYWGFLF